MSDRRRAIVIGCGKIGGGYNRGPDDRDVLTHALAYIRHPAHELVACVDPVTEARAAFIEKWKVPHGYATLDEAIRQERFDVASVCTPTGTHLRVLRSLLKSDVKAVFAEKPLDGDAPAALQVGREFETKGLPVAVNFLRRFDPGMAALKSKIGAGHFGRLVSAVGWYDGGVMNNGVHLIDLAAYLTGLKPAVLYAIKVSRRGADDPAVSGLLGLEGTPFHLVGRPEGEGSRFELEVAFDRAIVAIEDSGFAVRVREFEASDIFDGAVVPARGAWTATKLGTAMLAALDELVAWAPGKPLSSDIASATESIEVMAELRRMALENDR